MNDEELKRAIIEFNKKYYKRYKKGPSVRTILKKFKGERRIQERFYRIFGGIANAWRQADIPISEEQIKQTWKALKTRKKKRVAEAQAVPSDYLKQSYERQKTEERRREEFAQKRAEELAMLVQDPNKAISDPVVNAIENTALPVLLEKKYGIEATVPEILEMLKQYKQAKDEGWYVDDVMEWGVLSEEEREAFRELYNKAYCEEGVSPTRYLVTLEGAMESLKGKKDQLLREIRDLEQKKKDFNWNYSLLKTQYDNLKNRHDEAEKQLDDQYYQKAKDYAFKFGIVKRQMQDEIGKLINERERLKTECTFIKKQTTSSVQTAKEAVKERDKARSELKQLRALVGPKGIVPDLAKQKDELKAQLKERDQQLAEKAMQVTGKWLNQEEALLTFNEESKRLMGEVEGMCRLVSDEVERRIEKAGPALRVLEFLESELPDEKFKELTFAINMAQVKRESQNPDNPFFARLPLKKKELLGVFPTTEEYRRLHREKMEILHKRREANLQKIRETARDIATIEMWGKIGERLLNSIVKPVGEAYFNPKKTATNNPVKNDRIETDGS